MTSTTANNPLLAETRSWLCAFVKKNWPNDDPLVLQAKILLNKFSPYQNPDHLDKTQRHKITRFLIDNGQLSAFTFTKFEPEDFKRLLRQNLWILEAGI